MANMFDEAKDKGEELEQRAKSVEGQAQERIGQFRKPNQANNQNQQSESNQ